MNRFLHLIFLALFISESANCQHQRNENLNVFKTKEYSISYPTILKLDDSGVDGSEFILFTEKESETDDFVENINLVIQDLTNIKLDLDELIEVTRNELGGFGEIVESKKLTNKEYQYHKVICTYTQNGAQLTFLQHGVIANNKLYVLTFSAKKDTFEKYYPKMEEVMLSFTLF